MVSYGRQMMLNPPDFLTGFTSLLRRGKREMITRHASTPNSQIGWGLPDLRKLLGRTLAAPKVYRGPGDLGLVLEGNLYETLDFELYSRAGRLVHRGRKEASVARLKDLGPISPGVYLLRWRTSERQGSQVVVIPTR